MHSFLRAALLVVPLCLAGCDGKALSSLFFLEVRQERLCKMTYGVEFPGVPLGALEATQTLDFEPPSIPVEEGDGQALLESLRIEVRASSNDAALEGIERVGLFLRPTGSSEEPTSLLELTPGAGEGGVRVFQSDAEPVDVLALLRQGPLELTANVAGQLPESDWTVDVEACASLSVRVNYLARLF
ncbi:MAG: hypothetical protein L0Y66_20850 [Myxococcaceae bacterium]|nr:hypothetical protein [Myxococcaceae bacterium]MCI0669977.1 hypothetical protein [Myxococcaceae bacterium]